jgi:predicted dehydrogenase
MRIAILGCGSIGSRHLCNLKSLGYTDLLAYDPFAETCQRIEQDHDVSCYTSLDTIWENNPGVAFITAPSNVHTELALQAAYHNCHLFIEKPLAHNLEGIEVLCAEVEKRSLCTMVACNMRFHPGPAKIKQLVDEYRIGQILAARIQTGSYLPGWRPWQNHQQSYSASTEWGGAILDCIHEIDLALWYFGSAEVVGSAYIPAKSIGLETDGLAEILLSHDSSVLSNVHLNFIQRDYRRTCQIIGSKGTLYWDFSEEVVILHGDDGQVMHRWKQPDDWQVNQMYVDEITHFLQAIQQNVPTINPLQGGLAALKIALKVRNKKFAVL